MDSPRYTVIIPMSRFRADQPALVSLRETPPPKGGMQILVATGQHPARQRNTALDRAQGEIVVFLDNDCSLGAGYWQDIETALTRPEVEIVGGPALLRPQATAWEQIFHALLTHSLIVGPVSARYAPRGKFRAATQADLILCNLVVRRFIFKKIGPLSTELYPNEENEWLDRTNATKVGVYYDPGLRVFRPQRAGPRQMGLTLLRYGMGRTRQFWISGWRLTVHQFLPVMLIAAFAALLHWRLERDFAILWLATSAITALTCHSLPHVWQRIVAGLIAPLIPLTYAAGQVLGWFGLLFPMRGSLPGIVLLNERGEQI